MKIVIFGTGECGQKLLSTPLKENCQIVCVCDNSKNKHGMLCNGYLVYSPDVINETNFDIVIVATGKYAYDVKEQLLKIGVPEEKILLPYGWDVMEYYDTPLNAYFAAEKKDFLPFEKKPAKIYKDYKGETFRAHNRREREGFFEKYCKGEGLDIGYGSDPITPNVYGWDIVNGDAQYLNGIDDESFDYVYSSHCLEHMFDVRIALKNWFRVVKKGGFLLIAIPHRDLYEKKKTLPSRWNFDHKHMFLIGKKEKPDTIDIVEEIRESLVDYDIKYVKTCDDGHTITDPTIHSDGEYQIEIVIQKLNLV